MLKGLHYLVSQRLKPQYFKNYPLSNNNNPQFIKQKSQFTFLFFSTFSYAKPLTFSFTDIKSNLVASHQYEFGLLDQRQIANALKLTIDILVKEGPLNKARYQKHWSTVSKEKMLKYSNFVEAYLKNSVKKRLAQGIFFNKELIGVSVSQDISFAPPNFQILYSQAYDLLKYDMTVLEHLFNNTPQIIKSLLNRQNQLIDMGNTVIKQQHRGKGLLNNLINQIEKTALRQKFQFVFVCSTNIKISATLQKRGYSKICDVDCKEIEIENEKPFENIDEHNRWPSLWLKEVRKQNQL